MPSSSSLPFFLPLARDEFRGFRVKTAPEDFIVEELPLYEPSGTGSHSYFLLEKRGLNTRTALRQLARALNKDPQTACCAGLKDAQAVSRQWVSFEHLPPQLSPADLDPGPGLKVLRISRHANKLRQGHLRGNRFLIRLRPPATATEREAEERSAALAEMGRAAGAELARRGLPNFFGPQRFGREGANPLLGKLLVRGAAREFEAALPVAGLAPAAARDRKLRNFLVNAFQAELFNRLLVRRLPDLGALWSGDLAQLRRNGAVFLVSDPDREQARCDSFEISPSGPLFGPRMPWPSGRAGEMEREILAEAAVTAEDFGRKEAEGQPGARRPLRVPLLEALEIESDAEGVRLRFALPAGSYATVLLRELLGDAAAAEADPTILP